MKASFNQNDVGLYPIDDEFVHDCENCIFLRNSYKCVLMNSDEKIAEELPSCFSAIFTAEPLSDIFKL